MQAQEDADVEQKRLQREIDDLEAQVRKLQSVAEDEESRDLHSREFARLRVKLGGMCWVKQVLDQGQTCLNHSLLGQHVWQAG